MQSQISIEVNGIRFDNFLDISAVRGYSKAPSEFSFTATTSAEDLTLFPILVGDICRIFVGETPFIAGFVQSVDVSHDASNHRISVKGCSFIVDLIDSTMDNTYVFKGPLNFIELVQAIIQKAGLNIDVIEGEVLNDLNPVWVFEQTAGKFGDSVWSYLCKQAAQRNILITENGNGDLVLTRGLGKKIDYQLIKKMNNPNNNILSSQLSVDHKERFHHYIVRGQAKGGEIGKELTKDKNTKENVKSVDKVGEIYDDRIRRSRSMAKLMDNENESTDVQGKAEWLANMAITNCFNYSCTHQGFKSTSGVLLEPGQSIYVDDVYSMVQAELIIDEITFNFSSSGSIATIKLLPIGAYTKEPVPLKPSETGQSIGAQLTRPLEQEKTKND